MSGSKEESAKKQTAKMVKGVKASGEHKDKSLMGFDPNHTRRLLLATAGADPNDIVTLLTVYVMRGTNTEKMLRTSTDEATVTMKTLFEKYNVKPKVNKGDRNTITLSRIAASFPSAVCRLCHNTKVRKIPVNLDKLPLSYPKAMTTPVFASLIPTSDESLATMMLNAHLYYLVRFDVVVNRQPSSWDKVVKYQKAAYQSRILTEEEKIKCCLEFKVLYKDDRGRLELMPEVALAAFQIADLRRRLTIPAGYFLSDWHDSFLRMGSSIDFLEDLYKEYGYSLDDIKKGKDKENAGTKNDRKRSRPSSVDTSAKRLRATENSPTSEDGKGSKAASTSGQDQAEKATDQNARAVERRQIAEEEEEEEAEKYYDGSERGTAASDSESFCDVAWTRPGDEDKGTIQGPSTEHQ